MPDAERTTVRAIMDTQREVFEQGREQGRQEARRETAQDVLRKAHEFAEPGFLVEPRFEKWVKAEYGLEEDGDA